MSITAGFLKDLDYGDLGTKANKLWFWALFLTIFLLILKLQNDKEKDENTKSSLVSNCCDIVIAANGSGYITANDGFLRLLGFTSAYLGYRRICSSLKNK